MALSINVHRAGLVPGAPRGFAISSMVFFNIDVSFHMEQHLVFKGRLRFLWVRGRLVARN